MNITIVGGGNIGTQFTVHFAELGNNVKLYTSQAEIFSGCLKILDADNNVIHSSSNYLATYSAEVAFKNVDIIFITVPAFAMDDIAAIIYPYVYKGLKIVLVPGTGGGEWIFKKCIDKGAEIFGLQRVPSVARLIEKGSVVRATGYRDNLFLGAISNTQSLQEIAKLITETFSINCLSLPNYLSVTLTPSNPILHTARLYNLFSDYKKGMFYDINPLFYEQWNDECSDLLFAMDDELQNICHELKELDLKSVISLRKHYDSYTPQELTRKLQSIKGFKGLLSPMKKNQNGYIPDFSSRYFCSDFPFGLSIIVQIANFTHINCTNLKKVLNWYNLLQPDIKSFSFNNYGINNRNDFIEYYLQII